MLCRSGDRARCASSHASEPHRIACSVPRASRRCVSPCKRCSNRKLRTPALCRQSTQAQTSARVSGQRKVQGTSQHLVSAYLAAIIGAFAGEPVDIGREENGTQPHPATRHAKGHRQRPGAIKLLAVVRKGIRRSTPLPEKIHVVCRPRIRLHRTRTGSWSSVRAGEGHLDEILKRPRPP